MYFWHNTTMDLLDTLALGQIDVAKDDITGVVTPAGC